MGLLLIAVRDELVWIDCEMTGLDLKSDRLIEIAVLVTDADLNILGEGIDVVIHAPDEALSGMIEVVTQMHDRSGLTEEVRASTVDVPAAEQMVLDYIRGHVKQAKTAPLAGNSIATDRGFIARDMPALDDFLHYRMIDVSSIKELCRRWYPADLFRPAGEGAGAPRAGRHPRVDPRAAVLPAHRVRRCRRGRRPAISPRSPPNWGPRRPTATKLIRLPSARAASIDDAAVPLGSAAMVAVVQLVEHQVVILAVAGSSPVSHPAEVGGLFSPPTFFFRGPPGLCRPRLR